MQRIRTQSRAARAAALQSEDRRDLRCTADRLHQRSGSEGDGTAGCLISSGSLPITSTARPCYLPVLVERKDAPNVLNLMKFRNNLADLGVFRPRHTAILPVFLPVSRETASRDAFAGDCQHKQAAAEELFRRLGITFAVYAEGGSTVAGSASIRRTAPARRKPISA